MFSPTFGPLMIKQPDVRMIVCSFDMGETKIVLLPRPYTKPVKAAEPPPPVQPDAVKKEEPAPRLRARDDAAPSPMNFALPKKDRRPKHVR